MVGGCVVWFGCGQQVSLLQGVVIVDSSFDVISLLSPSSSETDDEPDDDEAGDDEPDYDAGDGWRLVVVSACRSFCSSIVASTHNPCFLFSFSIQHEALASQDPGL